MSADFHLSYGESKTHLVQSRPLAIYPLHKKGCLVRYKWGDGEGVGYHSLPFVQKNLEGHILP